MANTSMAVGWLQMMVPSTASLAMCLGAAVPRNAEEVIWHLLFKSPLPPASNLLFQKQVILFHVSV